VYKQDMKEHYKYCGWKRASNRRKHLIYTFV